MAAKRRRTSSKGGGQPGAEKQEETVEQEGAGTGEDYPPAEQQESNEPTEEQEHPPTGENGAEGEGEEGHRVEEQPQPDPETEIDEQVYADLLAHEAQPFRENCVKLEHKDVEDWLSDPPKQWVTYGVLGQPRSGDVYLFDLSMLGEDTSLEKRLQLIKKDGYRWQVRSLNKLVGPSQLMKKNISDVEVPTWVCDVPGKNFDSRFRKFEYLLGEILLIHYVGDDGVWIPHDAPRGYKSTRAAAQASAKKPAAQRKLHTVQSQRKVEMEHHSPASSLAPRVQIAPPSPLETGGSGKLKSELRLLKAYLSERGEEDILALPEELIHTLANTLQAAVNYCYQPTRQQRVTPRQRPSSVGQSRPRNTFYPPKNTRRAGDRSVSSRMKYHAPVLMTSPRGLASPQKPRQVVVSGIQGQTKDFPLAPPSYPQRRAGGGSSLKYPVGDLRPYGTGGGRRSGGGGMGQAHHFTTRYAADAGEGGGTVIDVANNETGESEQIIVEGAVPITSEDGEIVDYYVPGDQFDGEFVQVDEIDENGQMVVRTTGVEETVVGEKGGESKLEITGVSAGDVMDTTGAMEETEAVFEYDFDREYSPETARELYADLPSYAARPFRRNIAQIHHRDVLDWLLNPPEKWLTWGQLYYPRGGDLFLMDVSDQMNFDDHRPDDTTKHTYRRDGYTWYCMKARRNIGPEGLKKSYWCLRLGEWKKESCDKRFQRHEYTLDDRLVVIHYIGDESVFIPPEDDTPGRAGKPRELRMEVVDEEHHIVQE